MPAANTKKRPFKQIIFAVGFFLLFISRVWATEYTIKQLTDNNYNDYISKIHNGQVVWEGYDGRDYEIFFYDGTQIIQLTDNNYLDQYPQIHNGQVVWEGVVWDGWPDFEIFFYDGAQIIQLTDNNYSDYSPQIHNGQVVWKGWDGPDFEIFFYDGAQIIQLTDNNYHDLGANIHNGQVVWNGYDDNDYEIFLYNGTQARQLTNNNYNDFSPQIHNGQVVWEGYDGRDYEIFFYDGAQTRQLTDNNYRDQYPQIHNGQVVWEGWKGVAAEIFLYNGTQTIQLTDNWYWDSGPHIHNEQVAWYGHDGYDYEIFLATLAFKIEILDGVDFSAGKEVSSKPEKLASGGIPVEGAVTDGVTRLLLRLNVGEFNEVKFSLEGTGNPKEDGVLRSIDGSQESQTISVYTESTSAGETAFAIYQAPENFVRSGHNEDKKVSERTVTLKVEVGSASPIEKEIKLVRPTVILVHGIWSMPERWDADNFSETLANEWPGIRIFPVNYELTNDRHFEVNRNEVKEEIEEARKQYRSKENDPKEIAMIQADVISHSMGGLLARIYAGGKNWYSDIKYKRKDNFHKGDISKLIAIDSPHYGSFMADILMEFIDDLEPERREWILRQFRNYGMALDRGAVEDLMMTSEPISHMNKIDIIPASHAIVGDYQVNNITFWFLPGSLGWAHRMLTWVSYDTRPYVVQDHSDLLVSVESQEGGLVSPASTTFGHHHMDVTGQDVANHVINLLNAPPDSHLFESGFPTRE